MPTKARIKAEDAIYHIMSRSISEVDLFQSNEDKDYYLRLLKRYKEKVSLQHIRILPDGQPCPHVSEPQRL